ncbi:MAG: translation elongation factor 4 [Deltaproteobacteria bacterium]|nr:translation elongation factor 4 [Deltaproteobacteria bacterium]
MNRELIRNFAIVAHIDHGKSTLADRLLELTGTVGAREAKAQFLDSMDLERERGITIKANAVRMQYKAQDGQTYVLNLIDTPGHVDFAYEVSRSLAACEGAILVVDATQGVEAQTLANAYLAADANLELVAVINKIDLPAADVESARAEIEEVVGIEAEDAPAVSAKEGTNIQAVLEAIVHKMPPPAGDPEAPLKALIFDSWFDSYRGVVTLIRVLEGTIRTGETVRFWSTGQEYEVQELGCKVPNPQKVKELGAGEVGLLIAGVKDVAEAKVGDTVTHPERPCAEPFPGFKEVKPMVFSGIYPVEAADYDDLREAMEKLRLNDGSFTFEPEVSEALGFGFRCGFLGLLHMEIVQERLEREFDLDLITTAPSVIYRVTRKDGTVSMIDNPARIPTAGDIQTIEEPFIDAHVHVPQEYVGAVIKLCEQRRGIQQGLSYPSTRHVQVDYQLPLAEVVLDFYDKLKTVSRGYASLDYEPAGYVAQDLVKIDLMVNGDQVDALSIISHKDTAHNRGRDLCVKMKEVMTRQMFDIAIQAALGTRVIARTTVKAYRKNVTAKCYGGDISRKRKLLEKQKEGKRRMKQVGSVEIPQEAFLAVLRIGD